ncbi:zinc ribbon domain-containing protein [Halobium salinum]|uniref:Zinc ribbon domain-containing protein n=1 Tax=Halobium salinum TaxID=1364940 RepID=A0ABD5P951_9EURY|nr:zinc ribbon domain-containing protein [Halobium salinum]
MEVWQKVLMAAGICVAPSLLFLGLWRGLMRLRDDDLIDRTSDDWNEPYVGPTIVPRSVVPGSDQKVPARVDFVVCDQCGAPNAEGSRYCHECLSRV